MNAASSASILLLACLALQGCDRRQSDGHSTMPPEQGAATEAPAEAPEDQSVQPAEPSTTEPDAEPAPEEDGG